ncbi:hypothetical protein RJ639_022171 [Escallonia herrerae]|uniref:Protein kinase domain-containing protein n=1 Tax=Escallonia herrerae TaxID=1293975 RepID=A0AA89AHL2_9ASTE|nr:hypothetical protein RJ639_022171 [Escallonia herrerae]
MDSECDSGIAKFASAKRSTPEVGKASFTDRERRYPEETGACEPGPRKATGEICYGQADLGPIAPFRHEIESSQSCQPLGLGVSDGSQPGKVKLLCSFGGKILHRPGDGKLRYVGGETRIISIRKHLSWEALLKKTLEICDQPHTIKYQLPGEDLDALISVSSDEDLQNMIEEYNGFETLEGSQRLRIFLVPINESEDAHNLNANTVQQSSSDYQYVVAVNGIVDADPSINYKGQFQASDSSQLKTNLYRNNNSHCAPHPSSVKEGLGNSCLSPDSKESQTFHCYMNQSSAISPLSVQLKDLENGCTQLYENNSTGGSTEKPSLFGTAQLPPENSSSNTATADYCLPQHVAVNRTHCGHAERKYVCQPCESSPVQYHNCNAGRDFVAHLVLDRDDSKFDSYCSERPPLKERTFHSEKHISQAGNSMGLLVGSSDSIGSHPGMSHAFSDSQLQELGGRSPYCSQEGRIPSSLLHFTVPSLPSSGISTGWQERPVQQHDDIRLVNSQVQTKLNVRPPVSCRTDLVKCSLESKLLNKSEYTYGDTSCSNEKYHSAKGDLTRCDLVVQNHNDEKHSSFELINGFDVKDPFLVQGGKICENKAPATATEYTKVSPNVNCYPISVHSAVTPTLDLQGTDDVALASSPFRTHSEIEQPQNIPLKNSTDELISKSQMTVQDEQHISTRIKGSELGRSVSRAKKLGIAGEVRSSGQQSHDDSFNTDLHCDFFNGLISHESLVRVPVACQRKSSGELHQSEVSDAAGSVEHLNKVTLVHYPVEDAVTRTEVSLLDDDFLNHSQKVKNLGHGECSNENQKVEGILLSEYSKQNPLESVNIMGDMGEGNSAEEAKILIPESDSEDAKADDADKDDPFSDAMIAEIEADIYGLQIIKNADLEELQELGAGTYGTVYHGKWRGSDVAIKRIKNSCFAGRSSEQERLTKDFWREARILSNLHHPNVVAFYGVVPDGAGGTLATVTEYMANGSLKNVLLKKKRWVGDFGLSRIKRNTLVSGGVRGTLPWMAPELLNGSSKRVSEKDTLRPPIPARSDPEWTKLMEQCWSADPETRPSFTEITRRLRSISAALEAKGLKI